MRGIQERASASGHLPGKDLRASAHLAQVWEHERGEHERAGAARAPAREPGAGAAREIGRAHV